jgi:hypothetical protein
VFSPFLFWQGRQLSKLIIPYPLSIVNSTQKNIKNLSKNLKLRQKNSDPAKDLDRVGNMI